MKKLSKEFLKDLQELNEDIFISGYVQGEKEAVITFYITYQYERSITTVEFKYINRSFYSVNGDVSIYVIIEFDNIVRRHYDFIKLSEKVARYEE